MDHEEYAVRYQVEEHHWWYLGLERITRHLLDRCLPHAEPALKIPDGGCGTGVVMNYLCRCGKVTGFDHAVEALRL
jgi:hypothetical protein